MSIHVGYGYLNQGIRKVSSVWRGSVESPGEKFCPEGEISLSYMNKRVVGLIFSHLKTIYLSDSFAHVELSYMGKIPILHGQKWEKRASIYLNLRHDTEEMHKYMI